MEISSKVYPQGKKTARKKKLRERKKKNRRQRQSAGRKRAKYGVSCGSQLGSSEEITSSFIQSEEQDNRNFLQK